VRRFQELSIDELNDLVGGTNAQKPETIQGKLFEIDDFSFDIEQVLNVGSR
jgi:hypothetical protein